MPFNLFEQWDLGNIELTFIFDWRRKVLEAGYAIVVDIGS